MYVACPLPYVRRGLTFPELYSALLVEFELHDEVSNRALADRCCLATGGRHRERERGTARGRATFDSLSLSREWLED